MSERAAARATKTADAAEAPVTVRSDPAAAAFLRQNQAVAATIDMDTILVLPESANDRSVLSHEYAHILQLRSGLAASRDASERAAGDFARGASADPGGAADVPLFNKDDGKNPPPFADDDSEIVINDEDITTPAVTKSGGRRYIEGKRVPNKSANTPKPGTRRLDADDIVRRSNESVWDAVRRVRTVIGHPISDTPLAPVWNAVVTRITHGAAPATLGRDRVLALYARAQGEFWEAVMADATLVSYLHNAGIEFEPTHRAPLIQVSDPVAIPWYERKLNLDHIREKAIGDNWLHALDANNLELAPQGANQYREAKQARLPQLRPQAQGPACGPVASVPDAAAALPNPDNMVEDPRAAAANALTQPFVMLRGNRAVEATLRNEIFLSGPFETLEQQRAHRRKGVWREVALPSLDPAELGGFIVNLPGALDLRPFAEVSTPREDQFVLSGDKYGVTIVHPASETLVRIVEAEDRLGPDMMPYLPELEAQEQQFGHAETPAIAYQFIPPKDGKPGEVRIAVGPGAYIEISEPAPWKDAREWEIHFPGMNFGGTFETYIVEMPDNALVPLPCEEIDIEKLKLAGGQTREPDKHTWRGAMSREEYDAFWITFIGSLAFGLMGLGIGALEAMTIAEVAAAAPEADIASFSIMELPGPGGDIAGEEVAADIAGDEAAGQGGYFEPTGDVPTDYTVPPDEGGEPTAGVQVMNAPADPDEYFFGKYGAVAEEEEEPAKQFQYVIRTDY